MISTQLEFINTKKAAKPFLKWAGGKTQLLGQIERRLPKELIKQEFTFIEPFVGSGSVMFWMLNRHTNIKHAIINDINNDLVNVYKVIESSPYELIVILEDLEREYHNLEHDSDEKKEYFYSKRALYNTRETPLILQAALFIFLNRTCFNGLYRVNSKNLFNVPIGSYKTPTICDKENILSASETLKKVEILSGDYQQTLDKAEGNLFFYFDPPYKPLSESSSFNSYAKDDFNDIEQIKLRDFCNKLDKAGHKWMLSNSDVRNENINNNFFDDLYQDFNIERVEAKRLINAKHEKRGIINELLITNY